MQRAKAKEAAAAAAAAAKAAAAARAPSFASLLAGLGEIYGTAAAAAAAASLALARCAYQKGEWRKRGRVTAVRR